MSEKLRPIDVLFIEDNPGDADLAREALKHSRLINCLHHVEDGVEAMAYLHQQGKYLGATMPDLILLDLNLPKKDGREVLAEIKADGRLRRIPVVILTTSGAEEDLQGSYSHHANCYIRKPINFERFNEVVRLIEKFWMSIVELPPKL